MYASTRHRGDQRLAAKLANLVSQQIQRYDQRKQSRSIRSSPLHAKIARVRPGLTRFPVPKRTANSAVPDIVTFKNGQSNDKENAGNYTPMSTRERLEQEPDIKNYMDALKAVDEQKRREDETRLLNDQYLRKQEEQLLAIQSASDTNDESIVITTDMLLHTERRPIPPPLQSPSASRTPSQPSPRPTYTVIRPRNAPYYYLPIMQSSAFSHIQDGDSDMHIEAHALFLYVIMSYFRHRNPTATFPSIGELYAMQESFLDLDNRNHVCGKRCMATRVCHMRGCSNPEHHHHDPVTNACPTIQSCNQMSYNEGQIYESLPLKRCMRATGLVFVCSLTGAVHFCTDDCQGVYIGDAYVCPISSRVKSNARMLSGIRAYDALVDLDIENFTNTLDYGTDEIAESLEDLYDQSTDQPQTSRRSRIGSEALDSLYGRLPGEGTSRNNALYVPVRERGVNIPALREVAKFAVTSLLFGSATERERMHIRTQQRLKFEKKMHSYVYSCATLRRPVNLIYCFTIALRHDQINTDMDHTDTPTKSPPTPGEMDANARRVYQHYLTEFICVAWVPYLSMHKATYATKLHFSTFCRGMLYAFQHDGICVTHDNESIPVVRPINALRVASPGTTAPKSSLKFPGSSHTSNASSPHSVQIRNVFIEIRNTFQRIADERRIDDVRFESLHKQTLERMQKSQFYE